jgi:AraC-like DNA-binding protein
MGRVWRRFAREGADLVGVEGCGRGLQPRMHPWFGVSLVRSSEVVTVESRREVVAQRNWIILIPPFQLHRLRPLDETAEGAVTLLLGDVHLKGLALPAQAALVTDPALGQKMATLIAQLQRPVQSVDPATTIRPLLEQLLARSTPLAAGRVRRTSPLAPVRTFLHAHVSEPVPTVDLARMIGLTECHLIRAFHYEFGLPPHAYHLRLRLAVACERLARGLAVASVAYECGFADQSHLSRKLKAVYGLTPGAWAASVTSLDWQPGAHMELTAASAPDSPAARLEQFRSRPKGGDFKDFECRVRGRRRL